MNGEHIRRLDRRGARRRGAAVRQGALRAIGSTSARSSRRSRSRRSGRRRSSRSPSRRRSSSRPTTSSRSTPEALETVAEARPGRARCSTPRSRTSRRASGTTTAIDLRAGDRRRSGSSRARHMKALYAAVEGRHAGLPLFESIQMLGRESALRRLRRRARAAADADVLACARSRGGSRSAIFALVVRLPLGDVLPGVAGGAARRRAGHRTRSSCWAPRSTTAGRRRCSRHGSITRSSCTRTASRR